MPYVKLDNEELISIMRHREDKRKSGVYWLTAEGRAELHETFDDDPGCPVSVLLKALEDAVYLELPIPPDREEYEDQ